MIKAILFDADGVLINAERFSKQLERDYQISTEQTLPFFNGIFQECMIDKADLKEVIEPYLVEWGWKRSVDDFLTYWFRSEHTIEQPVIDFIEKINEMGVDCHLATNNEKYRVQYMVDQMGFGKFLKNIYSSASLGYKKPDLEYFEAIVKDLGLEKDQILFWDDKEENVTSAKEVGIQAEVFISLEEFKQKTLKYLKS